MIKPYIKEGVKGSAAPIVVLSEGSHVDKAIFDMLVHIMYDRPCSTTEEIEEIWKLQMKLQPQILKLLGAMPKRRYTGDPEQYELIRTNALLFAIENLSSEQPDTVEVLKTLRRQ